MDGFDFESIFKKHKEEINEAVNASKANSDAMSEGAKGAKTLMQLFRAVYVGAVEAGFSKSEAMNISVSLFTNIFGQFINQGR